MADRLISAAALTLSAKGGPSVGQTSRAIALAYGSRVRARSFPIRGSAGLVQDMNPNRID